MAIGQKVPLLDVPGSHFLVENIRESLLILYTFIAGEIVFVISQNETNMNLSASISIVVFFR